MGRLTVAEFCIPTYIYTSIYTSTHTHTDTHTYALLVTSSHHITSHHIPSYTLSSSNYTLPLDNQPICAFSLSIDIDTESKVYFPSLILFYQQFMHVHLLSFIFFAVHSHPQAITLSYRVPPSLQYRFLPIPPFQKEKNNLNTRNQDLYK